LPALNFLPARAYNYRQHFISAGLLVMHRLAQSTLVRLTALAAAMAFAILPAELLASCGCDDCGCPAAAGDAAGCCCVGTAIQAPDCCHAPATNSSARPAIQPAGCGCQQTVPLQPAGIRVSSEDSRSHESRRGEPFFQPALRAHGDLDRAGGAFVSLSATEQPAFADVPVRVMFCVWRN
jgi:hypothetical protein